MKPLTTALAGDAEPVVAPDPLQRASPASAVR